ncbi:MULTISPECIES: hypothetical protein [Salinivibrio]|uniref:Uncharacterized protein n=1 Tax=Salinivibrio proteolyticus TaxID=334715 RepID=A0ABY7LCI5_9GAMM|nr:MULTISPECIES: hypothetical protein [Salinivibrio]PCE67567.1 hypothetical protein B6G00_04255 [Salinivibrio sp. YCSC6]QCF35528.1 hypothetical protein E8E00_04700 [Salinivibrio sp. YCSC6]WBA13876.1 hypothetical protein N7E60_09050 [Salinivibrio proteolyticus]
MSSILMQYVRGVRKIDNLDAHDAFSELVINAAANRRGVRPDQMRLSLTIKSISAPSMMGPENYVCMPHTNQWQGLH